jgi:hypothetical protein
MFGSIEALVSFSSVWYVCVMAGRKMMVWLRALPGEVHLLEISQSNGERIYYKKDK